MSTPLAHRKCANVYWARAKRRETFALCPQQKRSKCTEISLAKVFCFVYKPHRTTRIAHVGRLGGCAQLCTLFSTKRCTAIASKRR